MIKGRSDSPITFRSIIFCTLVQAAPSVCVPRDAGSFSLLMLFSPPPRPATTDTLPANPDTPLPSSPRVVRWSGNELNCYLWSSFLSPGRRFPVRSTISGVIRRQWHFLGSHFFQPSGLSFPRSNWDSS